LEKKLAQAKGTTAAEAAAKKAPAKAK